MAATASQIYFQFVVWPCRDITTFRFKKQTADHIEILLPVSIVTYSQRHVHLSSVVYVHDIVFTFRRLLIYTTL